MSKKIIIKRLVFLALSVLFFVFYKNICSALDVPEVSQEIYNQQLELSGVSKLSSYIPDEIANDLENIGIKTSNWQEFLRINPSKIFNFIFKKIKNNISKPLKTMCTIVFIVIIYATIKSFNFELDDNVGKVMIVISLLCICLCLVNPVSDCIGNISNIIKNIVNFMLCYAPVMSTIMIASGQPVTATFYQNLVLFSGQIINYIFEYFVVPVINILFSLSLISCLTNTFDLTKIIQYFYKIIKTVLEFVSVIFTGILTLQNLVAGATDNVGTSAAKFALNSFVPVVGGMLTDAFGTVTGCLKLLKSSTGVFGILVGMLMFLPSIIECFLWSVSLNISACVSEIFGIEKVTNMLKSIAKIMSLLISVLVFVAVILIVSSAIVMIMGGK